MAQYSKYTGEENTNSNIKYHEVIETPTLVDYFYENNHLIVI